MNLRATRPLFTFLAAALLTTTTLAVGPALGDHGPADAGEFDIESFDGTMINIMVCKPPTASAANPAPIVLHSHGWGGSRSDCGFGNWLAENIGVVSISQRGFGSSGGEAHVHDPEYEALDNMAVIDFIAHLDWVKLDGPGDPVLGAIGGSYGGGYQFMTALTEVALTGSTRFDVLAPEITWHDLPESLAPNGVVRSVWVAALYGAGASSVHQGIHEAFFYSFATGDLPGPDQSIAYDIVTDFAGNSPKFFSDQGFQLDIPVLIGQGVTDNLFNINQGWHNFEEVLTPAARAKSLFIGYNGGHALPTVLPLGNFVSGDPCSAAWGGYGGLAFDFIRAAFAGDDTRFLPEAYHMATPDGGCVSSDSLAPTTTVPVGPLSTAATTVGVGAPIQIPLITGPATVSGVPTLSASVTSVGLKARAFFGLSVGTTPADALLIGDNVMPMNEPLPVVGAPRTIELPGMAVELAPGETLYLTVSGAADMFALHGTRGVGALLLENAEVGLPVV